MSTLDLVLAGIVLAFAGIGALRGWIAEALTLGVWLAAGLIAWLFAEEASPWFAQGIIGDEAGQRIMAFIALFVAAFMVFSVANFFLRKMVFNVGLNPWRRIFGALFGAVRGFIVAAIVVALAGLTRFPQQAWWTESRLAPPLQATALSLASHLPADLAGRFRNR